VKELDSIEDDKREMGSEGYRFWTQWLLGAGPVQAGDGRSVVAAAARPLCANLWRRVRGFWQLSGNFYQWSFRLKFIWATYFIWYDRDWIVKGIIMPKLGIYSKRELIEKVINDFSIFRNRFFGILIFGSYVKNYSTPISDIDVCIVLNKSSKSQKSLIYH